MSTFTPMDVTGYVKIQPPSDEKSTKEYLDQQLRAIERSISNLKSAVEQLQAEIPILWTATGETRP